MFPKGNKINDCLSLYLDMSCVELPRGWARNVVFDLKIVNAKTGECKQQLNVKNIFNQNCLDWGFREMMQLHFLGEDGWVMNNAIQVFATVTVHEQPRVTMYAMRTVQQLRKRQERFRFVTAPQMLQDIKNATTPSSKIANKLLCQSCQLPMTRAISLNVETSRTMMIGCTSKDCITESIFSMHRRLRAALSSDKLAEYLWPLDPDEVKPEHFQQKCMIRLSLDLDAQFSTQTHKAIWKKCLKKQIM